MKIVRCEKYKECKSKNCTHYFFHIPKVNFWSDCSKSTDYCNSTFGFVKCKQNKKLRRLFRLFLICVLTLTVYFIILQS